MFDLQSFITGDLSPRARVLTALLPAIIASVYFLGAVVVFSIRVLVWGFPDKYLGDARGRTILVGSYLRVYFFWVINPLWRLVLASGVSANQLTALAGLLGVGAAVAVGFGRFALGGWLFLFSGVLDTLDGRLARARNETSQSGAVLDSILDRYIDALMLVGLGFYYRGGYAILPVTLALMGTLLVPYVRAKGEALGIPITSGLMQRTERMLYLGGSVALSPIFEALVFPTDKRPEHWLGLVSIGLLAVTTNATAISRFFALMRAVKEREGRVAPAPIAKGHPIGIEPTALRKGVR
ncbi:MAG TPA: CDP-alcohol phosphatidyltransferase family protein [Polyangia bacterium]